MQKVPFRFSRDFDWDGPPEACPTCQLVTYAYKAGECLAFEAAADAAEAAGAGERIAALTEPE